MINFNYKNIKKAYKQYLFEQEVKAFLKREYGIEEKPKKKIARKPKVKKQTIEEVSPVASIRENKVIEQSSTKEKISELNEFLQRHSKRVGKEQCMKDLQRGLNIINGYKKDNPIIEERMIKEDGDFGTISNCCLNYICKKHQLEHIKKFVVTGAFNNAYSKSCFDKRINIDKEIEKIICDLNGGK